MRLLQVTILRLGIETEFDIEAVYRNVWCNKSALSYSSDLLKMAAKSQANNIWLS